MLSRILVLFSAIKAMDAQKEVISPNSDDSFQENVNPAGEGGSLGQASQTPRNDPIPSTSRGIIGTDTFGMPSSQTPRNDPVPSTSRGIVDTDTFGMPPHKRYKPECSDISSDSDDITNISIQSNESSMSLNGNRPEDFLAIEFQPDDQDIKTYSSALLPDVHTIEDDTYNSDVFLLLRKVIHLVIYSNSAILELIQKLSSNGNNDIQEFGLLVYDYFRINELFNFKMAMDGIQEALQMNDRQEVEKYYKKRLIYLLKFHGMAPENDNEITFDELILAAKGIDEAIERIPIIGFSENRNQAFKNICDFLLVKADIQTYNLPKRKDFLDALGFLYQLSVYFYNSFVPDLQYPLDEDTKNFLNREGMYNFLENDRTIFYWGFMQIINFSQNSFFKKINKEQIRICIDDCLSTIKFLIIFYKIANQREVLAKSKNLIHEIRQADFYASKAIKELKRHESQIIQKFKDFLLQLESISSEIQRIIAKNKTEIFENACVQFTQSFDIFVFGLVANFAFIPVNLFED